MSCSLSDDKPVTVWCPYYTCGYNKGDVEIWQVPDQSIWLQAVGTSPNVKAGIKWSGNVQPQDLFGGSGNGRWNYDQIIYPQRGYVKNSITYVWSINGLLGLDTYYPYPATAEDPFYDSTPGWPDDDTLHFSRDSPGQQLSNDITSISVGDQFWTYMMYKP